MKECKNCRITKIISSIIVLLFIFFSMIIIYSDPIILQPNIIQSGQIFKESFEVCINLIKGESITTISLTESKTFIGPKKVCFSNIGDWK